MQMDMQDFKIQVDELSVREDTASRLDGFCTALTEIKSSGQSPNSDLIKGGLAALTTLLNAEGATGSSTNWTAKFTKSPFGSGGGIALENKSRRQHLTVSVDRKGAFYNGTWAHYVSDQNLEGALFELKESPEGHIFEVMDGVVTRTCFLGPNPEGIVWAAPFSIEEILPEWLTGKIKKTSNAVHQQVVQTISIASIPSGSSLPPERLIEKKDPPNEEAVELTENKPLQEERKYEEVCPVCGKLVKRQAKFCPACGSKLSGNSTVIEPLVSNYQEEPNLNNTQVYTMQGESDGNETMPKQQKVCRKCGRPLGPGARFCNSCGTSV